MSKIDYQPTDDEQDDALNTKEGVTIVVDFELMSGVKKYSIDELAVASENPTVEYIHELKRVSATEYSDIRLFETKALVTLVASPLHHSEAQQARIDEMKDSAIKSMVDQVNDDIIFETAWAEVLFSQMRDSAPHQIEHHDFFRSVCITQAFSRSPSGWSTIRGDQAVIVLDATLKPFLEYIVNFLYTCKYKIIHKNELSFDWLSHHLAPFVLYFLSDLSASQLPWLIAPSEMAAHLSKTIVAEQLRFIIAHEVGHISLGHCDDSVSRVNFTSAGGTAQAETEACRYNWQQEFDADQFAINFCKATIVTSVLRSRNFDDLVRFPTMRMCIELLFLIFDLLDQAARILSVNRPCTSHPTAYERLVAIRAFHRMDPINESRTLIFTEAVFDRWLLMLEEENFDMTKLRTFVR